MCKENSNNSEGDSKKVVSDNAASSEVEAVGSQNDDAVVATGTTENDKQAGKATPPPSCFQRILSFYQQQEFLLLILVAILLARAYPPLGAVYLSPNITATWIAVVFIFLLSGISLRTSELWGVLHHWKLHLVCQTFDFGLVSAVVFGVSRGLQTAGILAPTLADGMAVCGCMPMTINMAMVLTKASDGDEPSAIFNAVVGNLTGVFLTPALLLGYLGAEGSVAVGTVFFKLALRVVLPIAVGQLLQKTTPILPFYKKHKPVFKKMQMWALVFIVYTVFCRTFAGDRSNRAPTGDIFLMIAFQLLLLVSFMLLAWFVVLRGFAPRQRVMGLFGCTHKSVAMGIPLINAIYDSDNPNLGLYTLPLLIWHPMQLVIGTFVSPYLAAYVAKHCPPEEEEAGDAETKQPADAKDEENPAEKA